MKWRHEAEVGEVGEMPCKGFEEGHKEGRCDRSQDGDVASGLCETRDLVF